MRNRPFMLPVTSALVLILGILGCWTGGGSGENPSGPTLVSNASSGNNSAGIAQSVQFQIVLPSATSSISLSGAGRLAGILAATASVVPSVTFKLTLINPGDAAQPTTTISKTVPADASGTAQASFEGIPALSCIGDIHIDGGNVGNYTDFHGATDLIASAANTVLVSPKGSKTKYDVIVEVILGLLTTQNFSALSSTQLVDRITQAIVGVDFNAPDVYSAATSQAADQIANGLFIWASPFIGGSYWNGQDLKLAIDIPKGSDPVTKVEFFQGNSLKLAEFVDPPYEYSLKNISGTSTFTAVIMFASGVNRSVKKTVACTSIVSKVTTLRYDGWSAVLTPDSSTPSITTLPFKVATFVVTLATEIDTKPGSFSLRITSPNGVTVVDHESDRLALYLASSGNILTATVRGALNPNQDYTVEFSAGELSIGGVLLKKFTAPSYSLRTVDAPVGVAAQNGVKRNSISWSPMTGANSYNIYCSTSPGVTRLNGQKIASSVTSPFEHTSLIDETAYYYVVTSNLIEGESAESNEVSATPKRLSRILTSVASATVEQEFPFSLLGVGVTAFFSDNSSKNVTADATWSGVGVSGTTFVAPISTGAVQLTCAFAEGSDTVTIGFPINVVKRVTRFLCDGNSVLTDFDNGLQWYRKVGATYSLNDAKAWAEGLTVDGGGWNLATMVQLRPMYPDSYLLGYFPTGSWSIDTPSATTAWYFHFNTGSEVIIDQIQPTAFPGGMTHEHYDGAVAVRPRR